MSRAVVTSLYCSKHLISLIMLDRQRQPLMRIAVKRRETWEWSDHTPSRCLSLTEGPLIISPKISLLRKTHRNRYFYHNQADKNGYFPHQ
jgi:hypothetical protein